MNQNSSQWPKSTINLHACAKISSDVKAYHAATPHSEKCCLGTSAASPLSLGTWAAWRQSSEQAVPEWRKRCGLSASRLWSLSPWERFDTERNKKNKNDTQKGTPANDSTCIQVNSIEFCCILMFPDVSKCISKCFNVFILFYFHNLSNRFKSVIYVNLAQTAPSPSELQSCAKLNWLISRAAKKYLLVVANRAACAWNLKHQQISCREVLQLGPPSKQASDVALAATLDSAPNSFSTYLL